MPYFDHAATSFPKPPGVLEAVRRCLESEGGNPGRSTHDGALAAAETVFEAREAVASLFGLKNPLRVLFSANATSALNLAIQGLAESGRHFITTGMEHHSVMRPLTELREQGRLTFEMVSCPGGALDLAAFEAALKKKPSVAVVNHASNVFGTAQDLGAIGELCRRHGAMLLVDASQSAGVLPIEMNRDGISLLAFAGHKGLMGPTGTGGLALSDRFDEATLKPLVYGGTGSHSASTRQPSVLPDRFESGTQNLPGLAGLAAGCAFVRDYPGGPEALGLHERALASYFHRQATEKLPLFRGYVREEALSTGVLSFNLEGISPERLAAYLGQQGIACRAGLHCAAVAHQSLGTYPRGTVRFSFGAFNTKDEIDLAIDVLGKPIP